METFIMRYFRISLCTVERRHTLSVLIDVNAGGLCLCLIDCGSQDASKQTHGEQTRTAIVSSPANRLAGNNVLYDVNRATSKCRVCLFRKTEALAFQQL